MKYFTSDMSFYKDKFVYVKDFKSLYSLLYNRYRIYDADNCGEKIYYAVLIDGDLKEYFKFEYSWYLNFYDISDDRFIIDSFTYEKIDTIPDSFKIPFFQKKWIVI